MRRAIRAAMLMVGAAFSISSAPVPGMVREAVFERFDYSGSDPIDARLRPGPDEYRNPVLQGFYPDPSITRVGDDYYLVSSTFAWFPGIPVFHSRDLVGWRQIGNAIDRPGMLDFKQLGLSRGVFAPAIEHHADIFYILNTCVDCGGNFVVTAADPAGPWSDPVWLPDLEGAIDPSLFVDADGSAWILNNGPPEGTPRYEGHRAIWIQRFDLAKRTTFGPRKVLVDGGVDPASKPIWIEGPHIIAKDGWYYLICAEGGTAEAHSQVVLRARRPDGPYTANPANPILTQRDLSRDRPDPVTSAGHADFVQTTRGEWWATFLAVRPYRGDYYNLGRETFLLPVTWENGWPRMTRPGQAIPYVHRRPSLPRAQPAVPPTSGPFTANENFRSDRLGPEWMMMRNPREHWYRVGNGTLALTPRPVALGDQGNPSFLARRQQHIDATASTSVRFAPARAGDEAGLVALQSDDYWYALTIAGAPGRPVVRLSIRAGGDDPKRGRTLAEAPLPAGTGPLRLQIAARGERYAFRYARPGGRWITLKDDADGTILSTKTAGGFVGAVFGLYAVSAQ